MKLSLSKIGACAFEASTSRGHTFVVDGPPSLGGTDSGPRPMETFLAALASCSGMDVVMILNQQKQPVCDLRIEVEGTRVDAVPAVFATIRLHFVGYGEIASKKLARAVELSVQKYCSVARMLVPEVAIAHSSEVRPASELPTSG